MYKESVQMDLLKFLLLSGQTRSTDVMRFLGYKYSATYTASTVFRKLLSNGVIREIEYSHKYAPNGTDRVTVLTEKGIEEIKKNDEYLRDCINGKKIKREYIKEGTSENDRVNKKLTDNGILLMFMALGIPVFMHTKPSLMHLKGLFYHRSDKVEGYNDDLDETECLKILKTGVYYTMSEYREFVKADNGVVDTFYGTRARGIFLSDKNCFVIYSSWRYNNKILRVDYKSEAYLTENLKGHLSNFTHIYRMMPEFSTPGFKSFHSASALIFSDGDMLAYATATGDSNGKKKNGTDLISMGTELEKAIRYNYSAKNKKAASYLTAATNLYHDIYVTPLTINGMISLEYLLKRSKEEIFQEGRAIIEKIPDFYQTDQTIAKYPFYSRAHQGTNTPEFVPVFNAKQMRWIREAGGEPLIVTYRDMLNMIAHSIKLPAHYYDIDTRKEFDENDVFIYSASGEVKGKEILKNFLKKQGLSLENNNEGYHLATRLQMSQKELYNGIAVGKIKIEDIKAYIKTKPYQEGEKHQKVKRITFSLSQNEYEAIGEKAQEAGMTVPAYIRKILRENK